MSVIHLCCTTMWFLFPWMMVSVELIAILSTVRYSYYNVIGISVLHNSFLEQYLIFNIVSVLRILVWYRLFWPL
jgi:hypothetical protein